MSLIIKERDTVWGEVHFGEHHGLQQPTHYLWFTSQFQDNLRGGLLVDAEEFIRAIASLPHDRPMKKDLTHFLAGDKPQPPVTLVYNAIEWNPKSQHVLHIGSIPFTVNNTRAFLDWFRYTTGPQWVDGFYGTLSNRPFTLTAGEKQGFEDIREFLATIPQEPGYYNVYEAPFLLALRETNTRFFRENGRSSYPEGYKFPYWYPEWVKI